jgi:ubiquinone/menaquinone biosynthesis C-methylase UbiE
MDWALSRAPFSAYRARALAGLHGDVLEIGFGTGLNLPFYPATIASLTIVDPNPGVHALAAPRLAAFPHRVTRHVATSEALPIDAESIDVVVSTWTLCSIPDVDRAMTEVRRVLRPGGRFVFVEHGMSDDVGVRRWQHRLTPLQRCFADGCHLDRDIQAIVARALRIDALARSEVPQASRIIGSMYEGRAIKDA